jgi:hypothetical protein
MAVISIFLTGLSFGEEKLNVMQKCSPFSCIATVLRGHGVTLFLGEMNTGTWPSRLGESKEWRQ